MTYPRHVSYITPNMVVFTTKLSGIQTLYPFVLVVRFISYRFIEFLFEIYSLDD